MWGTTRLASQCDSRFHTPMCFNFEGPNDNFSGCMTGCLECVSGDFKTSSFLMARHRYLQMDLCFFFKMNNMLRVKSCQMVKRTPLYVIIHPDMFIENSWAKTTWGSGQFIKFITKNFCKWWDKSITYQPQLAVWSPEAQYGDSREGLYIYISPVLNGKLGKSWTQMLPKWENWYVFLSSQEGIQTSPSSNPLFKQNWINQTPVSFTLVEQIRRHDIQDGPLAVIMGL